MFRQLDFASKGSNLFLHKGRWLFAPGFFEEPVPRGCIPSIPVDFPLYFPTGIPRHPRGTGSSGMPFRFSFRHTQASFCIALLCLALQSYEMQS